MALVIEDGAGVAGADTYVTLAEFQAYGNARGWTLGDNDEADEVNLRRAFDGINRNWSYIGKQLSDDQAGAFPRTGISGIPKRVLDAQCELAYLTQGGLDLFATISANTTASTITVGPITIEDETLPTGRAQVVAVTGLLSPYLLAGAGQTNLVRG